MYGDEEIYIENPSTDVLVESCVGPQLTLIFKQPVAVSIAFLPTVFSNFILEQPDGYVSGPSQAETPLCRRNMCVLFHMFIMK